MARYLIVANQTLSGELLLERVRQLLSEAPCSFHVVVPATHTRDHAFYTEGASHAVATKRLEAALARFRTAGAQVSGEVGDASPMLAVRDALTAGGYDGVILSTLAPGASRWLKQDLPHRLERTFGVPVTHLTGHYEPVG
jgi:DNA-binding transcriptional LysR family regulator